MANDTQRVTQYEKAIRKVVPDKTVLDVGTGPLALLAKLCVNAGANHVTAVEIVPEAASKAKALVEREGLKEKLKIVQGYSVDLPRFEKPVDVVVSEIVGTFALEEGMAPAMLDLQKRKDIVNTSKRGIHL